MLTALGRTVVRMRWAVLAIAAATVILGGAWGAGVMQDLSGGGFGDPHSESARALERITTTFGRQELDVVVLYSATAGTVDDPGFRDPVMATLAQLRQRPEVGHVRSYFDSGNPIYLARDHRAVWAAIQLTGADDDQRADQFTTLRDHLGAAGPIVRTQIGGPRAVNAAVGDAAAKDIARADLLAAPVLLLLLLFVFGSLVAATTPLLVGALAILGAMLTTRALTHVTDVSVYAINIITLIGLGLAIDYSLLIVSRYREELARGRDPHRAVVATVATAGRAVAVSAGTIALALASLLLFPQMFLKSIGYGGVAAVLIAMLAAVTVLPALLAVLGTRVNAVRVPLRRPAPTTGEAASGAWARIAHAVMRRPVLTIAGVVAVLALLAAPFLRAEFGTIDQRVLPTGTESRAVVERVAAEFPAGASADPLLVSVAGTDPAGAQALAKRIRTLTDVTGATVAATRGDQAVVVVSYAGSCGAPQARAVVDRIRALHPPTGTTMLVGGASAGTRDLLASITARLPWMGLLIAAITTLVLLLAFGSVVLPVKAIAMNLVSIGASFGAVVWVFQDGHLSGPLGFTSTGYLEASMLVLMAALLFGLATDYEVFLLSRVREEFDATGDNTTAVATGLQRTGGIITSAALLLLIVVAGYTTSGITFVKMIGVGMIVAITVDATLVRVLLVPATMRLLGRWNWWAPRRLRHSPGHGRPAANPSPATDTALAAAGAADLVTPGTSR